MTTDLDRAVKAIEQNPPYRMLRMVRPEKTIVCIVSGTTLIDTLAGPDADAVTARASIACCKRNYEACGVAVAPIEVTA